jgi:DNA-binding XRE family transcriptional regulator
MSTKALSTANSARLWREASRLKQAEAASELGVPRYLLSNIETGLVIPGWDMAVMMARLYGCGIGDLFPDADEQGQISSSRRSVPAAGGSSPFIPWNLRRLGVVAATPGGLDKQKCPVCNKNWIELRGRKTCGTRCAGMLRWQTRRAGS